jgi:phenylalanyl-tRNA synthetase alpha subunit
VTKGVRQWSGRPAAQRGDIAYDPERVTGFGLDRLAMIMSGTPDIRAFTENDQRFLAQF